MKNPIAKQLLILIGVSFALSVFAQGPAFSDKDMNELQAMSDDTIDSADAADSFPGNAIAQLDDISELRFKAGADLSSICQSVGGHYFAKNPKTAPCLDKYGSKFNPLSTDHLEEIGASATIIQAVNSSLQLAAHTKPLVAQATHRRK